MNGDTEGADADPAAVGAASRPWTPAAAMEPVPPLAPPPARPGAGAPVPTTPRVETGTGVVTVVGFVAVVLVVAVLVLLVLHARG